LNLIRRPASRLTALQAQLPQRRSLGDSHVCQKLLQPLAAQLHASFSASGRLYSHLHIHQLFHAAIGSVAPQVASQDKLPIQVSRDNDTRQYNLYAAVERAKTCLGLTDLQAVGVAEEVIEVLRTAGIGVNQVRLLLDPTFTSKTRKRPSKPSARIWI
jgi:predicted glycoside hydrolase/deacetylase ChbG (UPF0249 family)